MALSGELRRRYQWFREHSGYGAEACLALARAEQWFLDNEADDYYPEVGSLRFVWEQDTDYDPTDYDVPMSDIAWGGILSALRADGRWRPLESLWGVAFGGDGHPDGDDYARIVRAELCLEAMPEPEVAMVIPDPCEMEVM